MKELYQSLEGSLRSGHFRAFFLFLSSSHCRWHCDFQPFLLFSHSFISMNELYLSLEGSVMSGQVISESFLPLPPTLTVTVTSNPLFSSLIHSYQSKSSIYLLKGQSDQARSDQVRSESFLPLPLTVTVTSNPFFF